MNYSNTLAHVMSNTKEAKDKYERGLDALAKSLFKTAISIMVANYNHLEVVVNHGDLVVFKVSKSPYDVCENMRAFIANNNLNLTATVDGHNWVRVC